MEASEMVKYDDVASQWLLSSHETISVQQSKPNSRKHHEESRKAIQQA